MKKNRVICILYIFISLNLFSEVVRFNPRMNYFAKNNEYFYNSVGYTIMGYNLKPRLKYDINDKVKIVLGLNYRKYFGDDEKQKVKLDNSLIININESTQFIFGSLMNNRIHNLDEQLLSEDNKYWKDSEDGFQFIVEKENLKSDTWLSWEKFIYPKSKSQEELIFGTNYNIRNIKKNLISLNTRIQVLINHKGGQIDSSNLPTITNANYVLEENIKYKNIKFGFGYFKYKGLKTVDEGMNSMDFKEGNGKKLFVEYDKENIYYKLEFWKSNKFLSSVGEEIFLNSSENPTKNIINSKLNYNNSLSEKLELKIFTSQYYDLDKNKLDYDFGFEIDFKDEFELWKITTNNRNLHE